MNIYIVKERLLEAAWYRTRTEINVEMDKVCKRKRRRRGRVPCYRSHYLKEDAGEDSHVIDLTTFKNIVISIGLCMTQSKIEKIFTTLVRGNSEELIPRFDVEKWYIEYMMADVEDRSDEDEDNRWMSL